MPIDVEEFETAPEAELRASGEGPTNAERVLAFLSANEEQAFTPKEIRIETDVPRGSVGVVPRDWRTGDSSGTAASTGR